MIENRDATTCECVCESVCGCDACERGTSARDQNCIQFFSFVIDAFDSLDLNIEHGLACKGKSELHGGLMKRHNTNVQLTFRLLKLYTNVSVARCNIELAKFRC